MRKESVMDEKSFLKRQMEALENTQKLTEHQKQLMFTDTEPIRADTKSEQHTV